MSTDTRGPIFKNAFLDVYGPDEDFDPETDYNPYTISGELTLAVLGDDFDHRGMASNHEATDAIKARLRAENPTLLAFTEFDSESGCFFAYTQTEAAAIELAGFITAIALENERKRPPETLAQRMERNVIRFSAADVDSIIGRQATDDELNHVAKAAGHSSMGEAFYEVVTACLGYAPEDDDLDNPDESV